LTNRVRYVRSGLSAGVRAIVQAPPFSIAVHKADQWEALLASAADREELEDTWEQWNANVEKLIAGFEAKNIPYVCVPLDTVPTFAIQ
jgi:hypothetical protein